MQPDDESDQKASPSLKGHDVDDRYVSHPAESKPQSRMSSFFSTPAPLKRLFDRFPLLAYSSNPLPLRASISESQRAAVDTLYIFGLPDQPSLNPTCLRYQTLLLLAGLPFETASSNNHASPTGSLPFLITANDEGSQKARTIPASSLKSYIRSQDAAKEIGLDASPAHLALLQPIRRAYLTALYLDDEVFQTAYKSFDTATAPLYVQSASRSSIVRAALIPPLRAAAFEEVTQSANEAPSTDTFEQIGRWWMGRKSVDEDAIYEEAEWEDGCSHQGESQSHHAQR